MGLLDYGFEDPNTAGLLSLGLRLMSTPGKFGTALGQAGLGAMGDMQRARAQQQDRQQAAQRQQLFELQMKQAQQAQADADGRRSLAQQSAMSPGAMAVSMNGGPTPAAASALPMTSPGFDYRRYSQGLAAMGDVGGAMAIEQALRKEQSKLKSVEPMRDPGTGQMVNVALYEDGTTKVLPFGVKPEIALQSLGDRVVAVDKNALPNGMSFAMGQSADSRATNDRIRSDNALGRAQSAAQFGITSDQAERRLGQKPTGPMSVTLQKELLESDDAAQSSKAVVSTLTNALKLNDKAYSGYFAKGRATLTSNLGGSESADATINIDNMMTGQGLEQMKTIFGAAPTEGERKILLEMQASADKTPMQRKDIMERAIAAAERRGKYAEAKAKAIRNGTYLTEGVGADSPGKTVKRTGTSNGRKVVEYVDGSIEYAD